MNILNQLTNYKDLSTDETKELLELFFSETVENEVKLAYLIAMTKKGVSELEFLSLARSIIEKQYPVQPVKRNSICLAGTGGDKSNSFNISTTVSFIVAASKVNVIKHGNKSVTSKSGSNDILDALNIERTKVKNSNQVVDDKGIAFLSAVETYPIMRNVADIRKKITIPTVFNLLGPVIHPYKLDYQVMGVYDKNHLEKIAKTLQSLGRKKAIVLHGAGGMDEATLCGDNLIYEVSKDSIKQYTVNAKDYGLKIADNSKLIGKDKEVNKKILLDILSNNDHSEKRDVVLLNAGIALYTAEVVDSVFEGIKKARGIIKNGDALKLCESLQGVEV